jgi:restriction system protein
MSAEPSLAATGGGTARRKTNVFEDIIRIAAALPWWVGISLAAFIYCMFHHYAGIELPTVVPGPIDQVALQVKAALIN